MKKNILLYLTIVSVFSINIHAQTAQLASADKKYDKQAYVDAIKTYERIAEKGYKSVDLFQKLGNAYYFNAEFDQAAKWYGELFAMNNPTVESEYYYRYAQSLRAISKNDEANEIMELFSQKSDNDSRAKLFKKNTNYLAAIKANSGRYKVEDAGINSTYSDYGAALYSNKLIFASARDTGSVGQRKHKWTDQYFTDLYKVDLNPDMSLNTTISKKFDPAINTKFHESTPTFSADGKTMYFTRNNYLDGKKGKDGNKITLIKLYKATLENENWTNVTELPFNSDNYSTAHPTLSADSKTLYFASDMPGTLGQSDLFKVKINQDGSFGTPENLGNTINTEGRETFPFISDENEMYFASDGHPGLGGLDVFMSKINTGGSFSEVQNIGSDINSPKDDFGYLIDTKSRRGFFSSNKDGGQGFDDIYSFLENKKLVCEQSLYGTITDVTTNEVLANTKITVYDNQYKVINTANSDEKGNYNFAVECDKTYAVRAERKEFTTKEVKVFISSTTGKTFLPIALDKELCKVAVGDDLSKCFGIKMIYFDLDKSNIKEVAALDLEKILDVLNQNPSMKIDIRSHTDSRQTLKYNQTLSEKRAKATIDWLIQKGVDSNRLTSKGYGETQLINKCNDDTICTEEEHQLNRRSEFIIIDL